MKQFEEVIRSYADAVTQDRQEAAQAAAMQALLMAGEEALRNPTPNLLLKQEAQDCEARGDWMAAEAAYRKVLALEERSGNFGMIAKAHLDLSRLLRVLGRLEEACQSASQATVAAHSAQIFPLLVRTLESQAYCALDKGDLTAALAAASEAVQIIEPGKIYDLMRAKALITRAQCLLASGERASAESDLAQSWELLQTRSGSAIIPGPLLRLASWWEVKSQLEEQLRNPNAAREAMSQAVKYLRQLQGPYAQLALARTLQGVSRLSSEAEDSSEADRASTEAQEIRRAVGLPSAA